MIKIFKSISIKFRFTLSFMKRWVETLIIPTILF